METLILLHGAIGASSQLVVLADLLKTKYDVHLFDFSGHGGKPYEGEVFSISQFSGEVLDFMDKNGLEKVSFFGYSMGGYVGMYIAYKHPNRINRIVTLATKFHWDEATAAKEVQMLNADKIEEKLPAFAQALKESHLPNDWKEVLAKTKHMLLALGNNNTLKLNDYAGINTPSLILLGDRDKMVTLDETIAVYKSLPMAQMGVLPATQHPIEQTNISALQFLIEQFVS